MTPSHEPPPRPWFAIRGSGDATTMWFAVLRKRERGVFIGTLAMHHSDHLAALLESGWDEVPIAEIGVDGPAASAS